MNVSVAVREYLAKIIDSVSGMKVLILDQETKGIVSLVYTQSQLLKKEVYLFERLDAANRERMTHLKAVCFLRPSAGTFRDLEAELREPKYGEYHLFFSNVASAGFLEELAASDEHEVVQQVHEYFADYYALSGEAFTLNVPTVGGSSESGRAGLRRTVEGLVSVMLSLKKYPSIRVAGNSEVARQVGEDLKARMGQEKLLFDFRQTGHTLLLILDRKNDPVTPLLHQWTYQAMVHELLGMHNNRVDLRGVPNVRKELQEVDLSSDVDNFWSANMYSNWGDLGVNYRKMVDELQAKHSTKRSLESINDIKQFLEDFPELQKLQFDLSKHIALLEEIQRQIAQRHLFEVCETEQNLAVQHDHGAAKQAVRAALAKPTIDKRDALKLVLLYALRYENAANSALPEFTGALRALGVDDSQLAAIDAVVRHAGSSQRLGDVFENKSFLAMAKKSIARGLREVENVYLQYSPPLRAILESALAGRLDAQSFPLVHGNPSARPTDVIIFFVGGATYAEASLVRELGKGHAIIGGNTFHNSSSFLLDISRS